MVKRQIVLVVHDVRSALNVGSLLRTADGLGVDRVYLTGYTPFPQVDNDPRLPHISTKVSRRINKTALGAENSIAWTHEPGIFKVIEDLKDKGFRIVALEQTSNAENLSQFQVSNSTALIVGSEVGGLDKKVLGAADSHLQIPMLGAKESFNVAVAAAIALYHLRWSGL